MTHGELAHVLMLCIHHFEENSQVDPKHSSSEATSVPFPQDVTVLWLDQLSEDFKALLSFPYINSKARPFDFTLEYYQNSTGVSLCWPLGTFPLSGRELSLPDRHSPAIWHHKMTAGLLSQHMPARRKLSGNSWHYMALANPHKPPIRVKKKEKRKTELLRILCFQWIPFRQM